MRLNLRYMDGIALGMSVLPDCQGIVDSPRCMMERTATFDETHDWYAEVAGAGVYARNRRLFSPNWYMERMVTGTGDILSRQIRIMAARRPGTPILVFRHGLSVLLNTDVDGIIDSLKEDLDVPLLPVLRESIDEDWVDGWRGASAAFWEHLLQDEGDTRPQLVGFPLFRLEGDDLGNVEEIQRICREAGIPVPVMPSLRDQALAPVSRSAPRLVFSFGARPQDRTDDASTQVPLPLGLQGTARFLRRVGEALASEGDVEETIARETRLVRGRLRAFVQRVFAGRAAAVIADPWSAAGLADTLREMGLDVPIVLIMRRRDVDDFSDLSFGPDDTDILVDPDYHDTRERLEALASAGTLDLVVGSGVLRDAAQQADLPFVEVTAPHFFQHFAASTPYMGYRGFLYLMDRVAAALLEKDYVRGFGPP